MVPLGFSLGIWGYNQLKTDIKDVKSEILRSEMNHKFDETDLNHKFEQQTSMLLQIIKTRK